MASREARRRRREIERRLYELDRLDQHAGLGAYPAERRPRDVDWRSRIAIFGSIVLVAALVFAFPGLTPVWIRQAVGLGPRRLAAEVAWTSTGEYRFTNHQPGDATNPVAWDPCKPIHYVINPAGGPPNALGVAEQAVARAEQVSGLVFEYGGETGARPHWDSPVLPIIDTRKPVLISWATADMVPQLAGDVAGIGGSIPIGTGGRLRYATGGITLDSESFDRLAAQPDGAAEERAIILHELGHVLGLAHVTDPTELMNAGNVGVLDYGPGDRAGLAKLGSGPCF